MFGVSSSPQIEYRLSDVIAESVGASFARKPIISSESNTIIRPDSYSSCNLLAQYTFSPEEYYLRLDSSVSSVGKTVIIRIDGVGTWTATGIDVGVYYYKATITSADYANIVDGNQYSVELNFAEY